MGCSALMMNSRVDSGFNFAILCSASSSQGATSSPSQSPHLSQRLRARSLLSSLFNFRIMLFRHAAIREQQHVRSFLRMRQSCPMTPKGSWGGQRDHRHSPVPEGHQTSDWGRGLRPSISARMSGQRARIAKTDGRGIAFDAELRITWQDVPATVEKLRGEHRGPAQESRPGPKIAFGPC